MSDIAQTLLGIVLVIILFEVIQMHLLLKKWYQVWYEHEVYEKFKQRHP